MYCTRVTSLREFPFTYMTNMIMGVEFEYDYSMWNIIARAVLWMIRKSMTYPQTVAHKRIAHNT